MDFSLCSEEARGKYYKEKSSYSNRDEKGEIIINKEMDICLLMAYGYILAAGTSYVYALNYFYRAYGLDPENPMVNLSLALAYTQHGLKRQTDNRQYCILQGLNFMHQYYDLRKNAEKFDERQEAHYNMGKTYHMLGMTHLAAPYYQKVLDAAKEEPQRSEAADLSIDAAYNLQSIYASVGNFELASIITKQWLVI